jgi:hypothetical protein
MSIRDALTLKPKTVDIDGHAVTLRRPSALDLLEALEEAKMNPSRMYLWLVWRHLIEDGRPVFASVDEVAGCDARMVQRIGKACELLYEEGRD